MLTLKKSIVILRPKVNSVMGFVYEGFEDLPDLIKFVGYCPAINPDLTLRFKKFDVKPFSIVLRGSNSEIFSVIDAENNTYEQITRELFKPEDAHIDLNINEKIDSPFNEKIDSPVKEKKIQRS